MCIISPSVKLYLYSKCQNQGLWIALMETGFCCGGGGCFFLLLLFFAITAKAVQGSK
jgi:hypothetical protein